MLIFSRQNLAIIFARHRKHIPARGFHNRIAPFLNTAYNLRPDRVAVMRNPEEQLSSWYRYRTKADLRGSSKSTADISFDQFVLDAISDDPPDHAAVGNQFRFLTSMAGDVLVHRIFAYDHRDQFYRFLEDRFGEPLDFKTQNVSPKKETSLDPNVRAKLRAARAQEFALYERLMEAGGILNFTLNGA